MKILKSVWIVAVLFCLFMIGAGRVYADCEWQNICDGGVCQNIPICDKISDFAPKPKLRNKMDMNVIPAPVNGPCHQQKVCDKLGKCNFLNVCP